MYYIINDGLVCQIMLCLISDLYMPIQPRPLLECTYTLYDVVK